MPDASRFLWLFFGFRGRLSRKPYFLAGLFLLVIQFAILFRFLAAPEGSAASEMWAMMFTTAAVVSVISNIALAVKRIQDFDKPGVIAVAFIIAGFLMYVALCLIPGTPGPNRYGRVTDSA